MNDYQPESRNEHGTIVPAHPEPGSPPNPGTSQPPPSYLPGNQGYVPQTGAPPHAPYGYPPGAAPQPPPAPGPHNSPQPGHPYYQPQPIYITQQVQTVAPAYVAVAPPKSVGLALVLTFLFGPLGLLYSSVVGGIVMFIITVVAASVTFGVSVFVTWPICMIWGAIAASNANARAVAATNYSQISR